MSWLTRTVQSSIGRKLLAGLSGLGLVGFLVAHLAGNLNMYLGADAMNAYADNLHHLPGFPLIELGLLAMFFLHIGLVVGLARSNGAARGRGYAVSASKRTDRTSALASRTMAISGMTLIVFLVVHLWQLRFHRADYSAMSPQGLGGVMVDTLHDPLTAVLYIFGSLFVGFHVFHGFQSALRSVGVNHGKYTPALTRLGMGLGVALALGFASLPIGVMAGLIDVDGFTPMASASADDADEPTPSDEPADDEAGSDDHN